jgi:hypothetical protein
LFVYKGDTLKIKPPKCRPKSIRNPTPGPLYGNPWPTGAGRGTWLVDETRHSWLVDAARAAAADGSRLVNNSSGHHVARGAVRLHRWDTLLFLAHAFLWECTPECTQLFHKRLKLAQLLGQLGIFLTEDLHISSSDVHVVALLL